MTPRSKEPTVAATAPAANGGFSLISAAKLLQFHAAMLSCRILQERRLLHLQQGRASGHLRTALGLEATLVGVAIDLLAEDAVVCLRGELAPDSVVASMLDLIRGAALDENLLQRLVCAASPMPSASAAIAAQLNAATGMALFNKTKKNGRVVAIFLDSAAAVGESGVDFTPEFWQDALQVAGLHQLPMIFVRMNEAADSAAENLPHSSLGRGGRRRAAKVEDWGLPVIPVDGNDVVAVYRVASESIARARRGRGATLIECSPCCLCKSGHLRAPSTLESAHGCAAVPLEDCRGDDPILKMEQYLGSKNLFSAEWKRGVVAAFALELEAAFEAVNCNQRMVE